MQGCFNSLRQHLLSQLMSPRHETRLVHIPARSLTAGTPVLSRLSILCSLSRLLETLFHPGTASLRALSRLSHSLPSLRALLCRYNHFAEGPSPVGRRPRSSTRATRLASAFCHCPSISSEKSVLQPGRVWSRRWACSMESLGLEAYQVKFMAQNTYSVKRDSIKPCI